MASGLRVVLPWVTYAVDEPVRAPRPPTLDGRTLGFVDGWSIRQADGSYAMYPLMAELKRLFEARFRLADTLWIRKARAGSLPTREQVAEVIARCAAVVTGVGLSGGSTAGAIRDAATFERGGVPAITICYTGYEGPAHMYARALGTPDLPLLMVPSPAGGNVNLDMRGLAEASFDLVVSALVEPTP